jgi:hypothetical protein
MSTKVKQLKTLASAIGTMNLMPQATLPGFWIATGKRFTTTVMALRSAKDNVYLKDEALDRVISAGKKYDEIKDFETDVTYEIVVMEVIPNADITDAQLKVVSTKYGESAITKFLEARDGGFSDLRYMCELEDYVG